MSFALAIDRITVAHDTRENTLSDGVFAFAHAELPALLDRIDQNLAGLGIDRNACLSIECGNTVPAALLLMALMRNRHSFILAPPPATASDLKPTPNFCSHRVTVSAPSGGRACPPEDCIRADLNPNYNGKPATPEKLYLRTSGSMGVSKIVVHDHTKLMGNARNCIEKYGFSPEARVSVPVPLAHMYGFGAEFLPAVLAGASIDLQDKTNLIKYLDQEKRFRPTIVFVTPGICEMLLKGFKQPRSTYHAFVTSGQSIREDLFRAFDPLVGGRLINQYGSTEMGAVAACDFSDSLDKRATAIGRPMSGVELRLDSRGEDTTAWDLYCRHPWGFEGYLNEEGEWLKKASEDGWHKTGDVAKPSPDGSHVIAGRADASVNRRGYLVLLSDIERIVEKLDGVGKVAVVAGKGETEQGQRVAAFCVLRPGAALDGLQVRKRCFELMPQYAIPDEVRIVAELPLLASGKLDRRGLEALVE
jgi:acyl-coenzyme A synthetase/AMP-(fatty) acid ligase